MSKSEKIGLYIFFVVIGYFLTTGTLNLFESSFFNSIPILGDILTGFDIAYIIKYAHGGVEPNEFLNVSIRIVNVMISVLVWYGFISFTENFMRDRSKLFLFIQVISYILLNFLFSYLINELIFKNTYEMIQQILRNISTGIGS
jgi:hypothetical protein